MKAQEQNLENPLELAFVQVQVQPLVLVLLEEAREQSWEILLVLVSVQVRVRLLEEEQDRLLDLAVFEHQSVPVSGSLSVALLELESAYV